MKISAIIPTYKRPELLLETLESLWAQTRLPDEILIGDDSPDDLTEELVIGKWSKHSPVPIRYFHHKPSLKEVRNVDHLYSQVEGDWVLHLHDDDPVYPRCLEWLTEGVIAHPEAIAAFGLQHLVDESGKLHPDPSYINPLYFRTPERAGLVDGFVAGATRMFPNNGFLVKTEAARQVGYSDNGRAGFSTDFYYGFRLGKLGKPFVFVHEFTAKCRMTASSQSRNNPNADNAYRTAKILLEDLSPEQLEIPEIKLSMKRLMPIAITIATNRGDLSTAAKWLVSPYYRASLLSPRGIKRALLLAQKAVFN